MILFAVLMISAAGAQYHRSFEQLPGSNGLGAVVYNSTQAAGSPGAVSRFYPHMYRYESPGVETPDLCYDTYFGIRAGGSQAWCQTLPETQLAYLPGSGIVHVQRSFHGITLDSYWFCPFEDNGNIMTFPTMVCLLKISNQTGSTISGNSAFQIFNFHLGQGSPEPDPANENIMFETWDNVDAFVERATDAGWKALYMPLTDTFRRCVSTDNQDENPWVIVNNGLDLPNRESVSTGSDRVCAFQWSVPDLAPGESVWTGTLIAAGDLNPRTVQSAAGAWIQNRTPDQILADEVSWWENWHATESLPDGLSSDETVLFRQSTAVLKMSQCRELNSAESKPGGQILASLPPGQWAISWVRDGAYAAAALAQSGHLQESRDYFAFLMNGSASQYRHFQYDGTDFGIGPDYGVSVCRYYGNGLEESDGEDDPNIELDNFGLTLWALGKYVDAGGDIQFLEDHWDFFDRKIAGILKDNTGDNGMLREDSSCWERHLSEAKQYGYSTIVAVSGLQKLAVCAEQLGRNPAAAVFSSASANLIAGLFSACSLDTGVITGAAGEENTGYLDAAAVELAAMHLLPAAGIHVQTTLAAFDSSLGLPGGSLGYRRLVGRPGVSGDWYDAQEWIVIDLRVAAAKAYAGDMAGAQELLDWVQGQAAANFQLIPELLTETESDYEGACPMAGFGAGAYILALYDVHGGQLTGITGQVTLSLGGAGYPGRIAARENASGVCRTAALGRDGSYLFPELQPGTYSLLAVTGSGIGEVNSTVVTADQLTVENIEISETALPGTAPHAPDESGTAGSWVTGPRHGFIGAYGEDEQMRYTVSDGRILEMSYPSLDVCQLRELTLYVTDQDGFLDRIDRDCIVSVERPDPESPDVRFRLSDPDGAYVLTLEFSAVPGQNTVLLKGQLEASETDDDLKLYVYWNPQIQGDAAGDSGVLLPWTGMGGEVIMGVSDARGPALALAGPLKNATFGICGTASDGERGLETGPPYGTYSKYRRAGPGNVTGLAEVSLETAGNFTLILSAGPSLTTALEQVMASSDLLTGSGYEAVLASFRSLWHGYCGQLPVLQQYTGDGGAVYLSSAMVLALLEDPVWAGAHVAAPAFPWGDWEGDGARSYQKVWSRDLCRTLTARLVLAQPEAVLAGLSYLDNIVQEADGSMPQHTFINGDAPTSGNEQYDETAAPVILTWQLLSSGYLTIPEVTELFDSLIEPAADFLLTADPQASQDRWEEEWGFSIYTLSMQTAALVCAADLATVAGYSQKASEYYAGADALEAIFEAKCYTTSGSLGNGSYYVRIDQTGNPNDTATVDINNGGGVWPEKDIVSSGFINLVRLGFRSPDDSGILNSLAALDEVCRVDLPGGPVYTRYNHDGYGEKSDGRPPLAPPVWEGIGRPWPMLTAERAAAELGHSTVSDYVASIEACAKAGILPEQVWDSPDMPELDLVMNSGTGSATPLGMAAAEYIILLKSIALNQPFDEISSVAARYRNNPPVFAAAWADPGTVPNDGTGVTLLQADVTDPEGTAVTVTGDLRSAGGSGAQVFYDDGSHGDSTAGDHVFSFRLQVPAGTAAGAVTLMVTAEDADGQVASQGILLTVTETGTATPTATPVPTDTPQPTPSPTPQPCAKTAVTLRMPAEPVYPGSEFYLDIEYCIAEPSPPMDALLFCLLGIEGMYWYFPAWSETPGWQTMTVTGGDRGSLRAIEAFSWPTGAGSYSGAQFIAAFTDEAVTQVYGDYDAVSFGWQE